jgi:hypothetical protein
VPTNFPSALDTFPSAVALAANTLNTDPHSALHGNLGDALAALEAKVGVDGSSVPSSLDFLLSLKAALASPTFTGTPSAPTAALGTNTTQLATTAFVLANAPALPADVARTGVANTFAVGPQTIQTGADVNKGLVVKGNSAGQSAPLQEWQGSSTNPVLWVNADGSLSGSNDAGGAIILREAANAKIVRGVRSNAWADSVLSTFFQIGEVGDGVIFQAPGGSSANRMLFNAAYAQFAPNSYTVVSAPTATVEILNHIAATSAFKVQAAVSQSAVLVQLRGQSSLQAREQADLDTAWVDSTDAARKARFTLRVWDTATREVLRGEADGSNPLIGFLGASAVGQQILGAAATDAASTQTLVNNIRAALIALGLCKT